MATIKTIEEIWDIEGFDINIKLKLNGSVSS